MELDLQSLFGLLCTAVLIGLEPATSHFIQHLGSCTRALLVSLERRHVFVTPCSYIGEITGTVFKEKHGVCIGSYAGVDYNLTSCRLQHIYHRQLYARVDFIAHLETKNLALKK
jgi:hypothetical protein